MTSTPMQRLRGSNGLWTTYIGVGGLSIPPGTNVSLGLRLRSSTEQRSAWCWSAETMIGKAAGLVIRGLTLRYAGCVVAIQYSAQKMWPSLLSHSHFYLSPQQAIASFNASDVVQLLADLNLADYETVSNDENATLLAEGDSITQISFTASGPGTVSFQKGSKLGGESRRLAELGVDELAAIGRRRRRHRRLTELDVDEYSALIGGATKSTNGNFYASNQSFVLNANAGALDGSTVRYSTIYSLSAVHSSGVTAHLDNDALDHLVPDLWMIDSTNPANPVWVKARETCAALYWNNEPVSREYEVDVCNFTLSHDGSASEFRIWFHVAPHSHAHWENTTDTMHKIYQTATAATVALVLNGTASEDCDNGTTIFEVMTALLDAALLYMSNGLPASIYISLYSHRHHRSVQLECSRRTTRQRHARERRSGGGDAHGRRGRGGSRHVRALLDGAGRPSRAGHRQAQPRCDLLPRWTPLFRCIHVYADPAARVPTFAAAVALAVTTVAVAAATLTITAAAVVTAAVAVAAAALAIATAALAVVATAEPAALAAAVVTIALAPSRHTCRRATGATAAAVSAAAAATASRRATARLTAARHATACLAVALHASVFSDHISTASLASFLVVLQRLQLRRGRRL